MLRQFLMIVFIGLGTVVCGQASTTSTATLDSLQVLIEAGAYEQALAESEAVLVLWEQEYGANSLEVARALEKVAQSLNFAGRAGEPRTLELVDRAVAIKSDTLGADHLDTASALYLRAQIYNSLGRWDDSVAVLEQVMAIRTRELGPDETRVGDVHGALGAALYYAGRQAEGLRHLERKVAILEKVGGTNDPQLGSAYANLASLSRAMGDLSAASLVTQKAIANLEFNRGPDHPTLSYVRHTMAAIHYDRGDYRAAMAELVRAQEVLAANDMEDHPQAGAVLNLMSVVAGSLGDHARAQECLERAVEIQEAVYGPDHIDLSYYLNNLGLAAQRNGDAALAEASLERSVRLTQEQLGPDHMRTVTSEYYLAMFEAGEGKLDAAEIRYEYCLEKLVAALGESHVEVARLCGDLAELKEKKLLLSEAEGLLDRALANEGAAANPALTAKFLNIRARVHLRQNNFRVSCEEALEVERVSADQYRLVVQTLSEGASQRFAANRTNGLAVAISALLAQEAPTRPVASVWDRVIRSRGLLMDELAARRRLVASGGDAETQLLAEEVFNSRSRLANLYVQGAENASAEQYAAQMDSASDNKAKAEAALAIHSAAFRSATEDRLLDLADIRQALPDGSALVAWHKFQRIKTETEEPWYCAFVLANDEISVIDLGAASVVDDLIDQWRSGLLEVWAPGGALAEAGIAANRDLGARLRDLVWSPCVVGLDEVRTVFAVPDGDLHLLPLAALPSAAGGYLLEEGPTFHYLSREKSLVRQPRTVGRGLLAVGDPAFDGRVEPVMVAALQSPDHPGLAGVFRGTAPDCKRMQAMQFGALPGTRRECEQVQSLAAAETQMLLGSAATEAAFKANLGGQRIVHLATHGYFLGSDCPTAAVGYADDPLLLSGLALAGANTRGEAAPGQEDGIVTAEEISLLDLSGVEWVVLSACDTGLGVLQPGEGVHGLQRAFETAGAGTVIMSLWPVEDQATQQWMSGLYRARLQEGRSTPAAVRQAALGVLQQRRAEGLSEHPFWWAGFVAAGDWQ